MTKRNFILLIVVLVLASAITLVYWNFRGDGTQPEDPGEGTNFFSKFNPFGNSERKANPPVVPPIDVSGYEPDPDNGTETAKLMKVSSMPIAGFTVFSKERFKATTLGTVLDGAIAGADAKETKPKTEFMPALRYVDRATGNIYQTFVDKIKEERFSKTIIPKIYDAFFGNHGLSVVMRYLKADGRTIETFVASLPKEYLTDNKKDNEVKGYLLPNNIKDISVSPDDSKIFYLFNASFNDSAIGTTLNLTTSAKVQVFDSPFTEWLSGWPSANGLILTTKPSNGIPGYAYDLDASKKSLTKVLGDINGLTTLGSLNGKLILYADGNLSLYVHHKDTRNSDLLGVKTLPEKCVWGKVSDVVYCAVPKFIGVGEYPDSWYQGESSFSDQIWKIDIKTSNSTLILDPATITKEQIDGTKLMLDAGENYLFFVNKKDSFLWKLDLK